MAQTKAVCKAALLNLDEAAAAILRESFRQFRIHAVEVTATDGRWLNEEKFDACVLRLEPGCEQLLESMRRSPLNRHLVIYGISMPGQHLRQVSKFGINVMLNHPLDRQAALKVVRATHLLVLHEFRRYVRVPVITEVQVTLDRDKHTGTTVEISGGGMSMNLSGPFKIGDTVELSFSLPNSKPLNCTAGVSWIDPKEGSVGVRYDLGDDRRYTIKKWIEDYLQI